MSDWRNNPSPWEETGPGFHDANAAAIAAYVPSPVVGPVLPAGAILWPFPPMNPQIDRSRTTSKLIFIKWTPVPACGYRFNLDGKIVSSTWNDALAETHFARPQDGQQHIYGFEPMLMGPGEKVQA